MLHTALRAPRRCGGEVDGHNVVPDVHAVLDRCATFADRVRSGAAGSARPASGSQTSSTSGSAAAISARRWPTWRPIAFGRPRPACRFVSNVDGADITGNLADLDPATTLFIVSSKTFTHDRDADQRARRRGAGWSTNSVKPRSTSTSSRSAPTPPRSPTFGIDTGQHVRVLGLGRWALLGRFGDRAVADDRRSARPRSASSSPGSTPSTNTSGLRRCTRNAPVMMAMIGIWYANVLGARDQGRAAVRPRARAASPPTCSSSTWRSNGKQRAARRSAGRHDHRADRVGRAGHQRPARVLPTAASGHAAGADRLHRLRPPEPPAARSSTTC